MRGGGITYSRVTFWKVRCHPNLPVKSHSVSISQHCNADLPLFYRCRAGITLCMGFSWLRRCMRQNRRKGLARASVRSCILHQLFSLQRYLCFSGAKSFWRDFSCSRSDNPKRRFIRVAVERRWPLPASAAFGPFGFVGCSRNCRCLDHGGTC